MPPLVVLTPLRPLCWLLLMLSHTDRVSFPEASLPGLSLSLILCPSDVFLLPFLSAGFSTSPFLELSLPLRKYLKVCLKNNTATDFTGFFPLLSRTGREKARLSFLCEMMCGVSVQNKGQAVVLEEPRSRSPGIQPRTAQPTGCPGHSHAPWGQVSRTCAGTELGQAAEHSSPRRRSTPFIQALTAGQEGASASPGPDASLPAVGVTQGQSLSLSGSQFPPL